jgi:hypothetical protein
MVIFIKAFSKMGRLVVMESITGKIKAISRDTFRTVYEQAKESGRDQLAIQINIKASTKMIKNGVTEFSHGPMVMCLGETTKVIFATDMDKCTGRMVAITRASGKREFRTERVNHFLIQVNCL